MTLRDWLERGAVQLEAGPHPEKARLDAEALLLHQVGKNRAWLIAHSAEEFAGCKAIGYAALLDRRAKGEPIQYIVGECEFYGLPFKVTPDVLIPRPETELLVEKALALTSEFSNPRIVDVGAGSGAIPIALAHHAPSASITATDISSAALAIAADNAKRNHVAKRVRFIQGDLLASIAGEIFDLIVSNPPYIPLREGPTLSVEVRDYEPPLALFAGDDGLDIYCRLIPAAYSALASGGFIALEIGHGQSEAVHALLKANGFSQIEGTPDLQGISRVVTALRT